MSTVGTVTRSRGRQITALVAAGVAVVGTAMVGTACSSSKAATEKDADKVAAKAPATVCAAQAAVKRVELPGGFPVDFPLPPGTVPISAEDRGAGGLVVTGVTHAKFAAVLAALHHDLPVHGYSAKDGETEPHDAESDWESASYTGRWAIRELPQCSGDTAVSVVARKR